MPGKNVCKTLDIVIFLLQSIAQGNCKQDKKGHNYVTTKPKLAHFLLFLDSNFADLLNGDQKKLFSRKELN